MFRGAAALLLVLCLVLVSPAGAAGPQDKKDAASFSDVIDVAIVSVVVRVVDTWGRPILGLKPEDFRVRAGKREIPVAGLDWIGESAPETPSPAGTSPMPDVTGVAAAEEVASPSSSPGKLVVFFVQADLTPSRISGQLRLRPFTREFLATLQPRDRVAVVSFDSHLKLWLDFTADRDATHAALDQAMLYGDEPGTADLAPGDPVSLAEHFDRADAFAAASPERGLEVLGRAMEPLHGEKTMIFLGWGLGRFGAFGVQMTPAYKPAVRALRAAHASVFVLDVTSADGHSLETGLEGIAEATGGLYLKTFRQTGLATEVLAKAISGHYVLTLDRALLAGEQGAVAGVEITLREKSGTVLARPVALR
jgi:VWFA-related protein